MPYWIIAGLFAVVFAFHTPHSPTPNTVDYYATGAPVTLWGVVADEPDLRPLQTKYTVAVHTLKNETGNTVADLTGKTLITDQLRLQQFTIGDPVQISGVLEVPGVIEDFSYKNYLARFGIHSVIYYASIEQDTNRVPSLTLLQAIRRGLFATKFLLEQKLNQLYGEPHASFMAGLLTGSRRGIPEELLNAFNTTGLTHIIAISGYNISIVIALISSALFFVPLRLRLIPASIAVIAFTVFVGASAAVCRAAIMGILGMLALQFGRQKHTRLAVLWTGLAMTAWNPNMLMHDVGFQLSFLSVIGIIELQPLLSRLTEKLPRTLAIAESVEMTIAAQLATAPLIAYTFGRISIVSVLCNLLVAPAIPIAMLVGCVSLLASMLNQSLGMFTALFGQIILEWIVQVATLGATIPLASLSVSASLTSVLLYYVCLIIAIWWYTKRTSTKYTNTLPSPQKATEPS